MKTTCTKCYQKIVIDGVDTDAVVKIECPNCMTKIFTNQLSETTERTKVKKARPSAKRSRAPKKKKSLLPFFLVIVMTAGAYLFFSLKPEAQQAKLEIGNTVLANSSRLKQLNRSVESSSKTGLVKNYQYYPVFASDSVMGQTPHSAYKAKRLSRTEMKALKLAAQKANPKVSILQQLNAAHVTIIPVTSARARYLHLKMLDNTKTKESEKGYCHVSGIFIANSKGSIYSRDSFKLINDAELKEHYPTDPPRHILEAQGEHSKVWHSALQRKFPYSFSMDFQQDLEVAYVIFTHRDPRRDASFFNRFNMQLSLQSKVLPSKMTSFKTRDFLTNLKTEKALKGNPTIALADAAGTISLRHYNASKSKNTLRWSFWSNAKKTYRLLVRYKEKARNAKQSFKLISQRGQSVVVNGDELIECAAKLTYQLELKTSSSANILAVDLVETSALASFCQSKPIKPTVYEPDFSNLHPDIISKMKAVAGDHYDIHTQVPSKMKSGQNGYVIITTEAKKKALTALGAFVQHKKNRGFDVSIITEKDFGTGKGEKAAQNIRQWLKKNYRRKNLLYVLMLGNPHPKEGDVPYKKVSVHGRFMRAMIKAGGPCAYEKINTEFKEGEGKCPTDYYFADLTGEWDKNGNGMYADHDDYGVGGIDGQPEVYVGRIPYYGLESSEGNPRDVDTILERIIRFENEAGDLSWRHNMFYSGDTFQRTLTYYNEYMSHNGADLIRHTHDDSLMFGAQRHDQRQAHAIDEQNRGRYGFVYYQEHGSPWGIGMMSTGGAGELEDDYPSVFALGGCDVASPEHSNNVCFSLLRYSGIGVYGGTRSVSSCSGNRWAKHNYYYPRLYFGMSTGETLWTTRANQSKGRTIGNTNFLINLLGDPSVVVMPQIKGESLSLSPGFIVNLACVQGTSGLAAVPYEVRNNTSVVEKYRVKLPTGLEVDVKEFVLKPMDYKRLNIRLNAIRNLASGDYEYPFSISSSKHKKSALVRLSIQPRKLVYHNSFDTPLTFIDKDKKPLPLDARTTLTRGVLSGAARLGANRAELATEPWADRDSFSVSFFQKINKAGNYDIFSTGNISVLVNGGRLKVWLSPGGWSYGNREKTLLLDGPHYTKGKWQHIAVTYNRHANELVLHVDKKEQKHKLHYTVKTRLPAKKIEFRQGGHMDFLIDELSVFNYSLGTETLKALARGRIIRPLLPIEGNTIHPHKVTLSWYNNSTEKAQLEVATDPNFRNIIFKGSAVAQAKMKRLIDKKRYFWRVNYPLDGRYIKSHLARSFKTDLTAKVLDFKVRPVKLPVAKVGSSGYNRFLHHFIEGLSKEERARLSYSKVSGPSWLRVFTDGKLFTNYGARAQDKGNNLFVVRILASDGTSKDVKFVIKVE